MRGAEGLCESGLLQRDIRIDEDLHLLEAVIRGDEEGGAIAQAARVHRLHEIADEAVRIGQRGEAGHGGRAVVVMRGVGVERVKQQQVRLVLREDVDRGARPHVVEEGHALALRPELHPRDVLRLHDSGGDHLLLDRAVRLRQFGKAPVDGLRAGDRDPVGLRRGEPCFMRDVIERGREDELRLVHPLLDLGRLVVALAHEQSVEEHAVLARVHAGDERGVIDPGDGRIAHRHRLRAGAFGGELAQVRHHERFIVPQPRREAIDADEDDVVVLVRGRRREGEGGEAEGEREREEAEHEVSSFGFRVSGFEFDAASVPC